MLVVLVGYGEVTFTLGQVLKRNAADAYALAPYDGRITARLAAALSNPQASVADRRRGDDLARTALRQDPVNVAAASALGLNADVRGDVASAQRAFAYAGTLSRRDFVTQLWAIENAVGRGDVKGAIQHYDIALRVKPEAGGVLFPVLLAASGEDAIRSELLRTLATKPPWEEPFVNFAAASGKEPRTTAVVFDQLRRVGVTIPEAAQASLLESLFSKGDVDRAWAYYAMIRPGASRDRLRDPQFAARLEAPTRFDWTSTSGGEIVGSFEGGAFDFFAPASVGGAMLRQVQLLRPGAYRLSGRSAEIDQSDQALPFWVLFCQNGRELGRVNVPRSDQWHGNFTGVFHVTPDCPTQTLALVAKPSEAASGLSGRIEKVELTPLG